MKKAKLWKDIYWYVRYGPQNLIRYIRYDVSTGINNLITYAPIIWRTREWDYAYLYEIMIFKLKRLEKYVRHGLGAERKQTADEIKRARIALEDLLDDETQFDAKRQAKDLAVFAREFLNSPGWWD